MQHKAHVTASHHADLNALERFLTLFTRVRAGEGKAVAVMFVHGFLVLGSYYLLRPLREALILSESGAEIRSYAAAFQAGILLLLVPLYGWVFRQRGDSLMIQRVNVFFLVNLLLFAIAGLAGLRFGTLFFIWVGVFNVMVISQYWAFAADLLNVKAGQRLFAVIAVGGSLGAIVGARGAGWLLPQIGPYGVMLVAGAMLGATLYVSRVAARSIPDESRAIPVQGEGEVAPWLGGFHAVFRSRYLLAIAAMVVLLNWVMSNGDFVLNRFVESAVADELGAGASSDDKAAWMGAFFSSFFFWINLGAFVVQLFLVSRLFLWFGVHMAILIMPAFMAGGFLLIELLPVFVLVQMAMGAQKVLDYSLMNTTRNALFLPTTQVEKYEGKTAIDTFFVRFGDMFSGAAVFAATAVGLSRDGFVTVNIALSLVFLALAWYIGRHYRAQAASENFNRAPQLNTPIPDAFWTGEGPFRHQIPHDAFIDTDAGDMLSIHLSGENEPLPGWLRYEERTLTLHCDEPPAHEVEYTIVAVARDYDGMEASTTFVIRRVLG
jgi:AAA family ATP:ADP antiporter